MPEPKPKLDCRILVPFNETIRKLGTIVVDVFNGDLYYTPSQTILLSTGQAHRAIDHVSFHQSGETSIKFRNGERDELRSRCEIGRVGYQSMFQDQIYSAEHLPVFSKKVRDTDVLFDPIEETLFCFELSIISGRVIVEPECVPHATVRQNSMSADSTLIGIRQRCLGWHSGNADKLMQYSLKKGAVLRTDDPRAKRTLLIPHDSTINLP